MKAVRNYSKMFHVKHFHARSGATGGRRKRLEYMKKLVLFIMINSVMWIWASYLLAFLGREEIAESLAETVVTSILGTTAAYSVKSAVEKISEYGWRGRLGGEEGKSGEKRDF